MNELIKTDSSETDIIKQEKVEFHCPSDNATDVDSVCPLKETIASEDSEQNSGAIRHYKNKIKKGKPILSESEDTSNDSAIADEATGQADPSSIRHREGGELFKRTMLALTRSELFSSFLKTKIDETRNNLVSTKKSNKKKSPKGTNKRKKSDAEDEKEVLKKKKLENGDEQPTQSLVSDRQPKLLEGAVLRDYQLDGLDWLMALDVSGASGILADEMGLGKTIQVIALVSFLIEVGSAEGPFLVIGPLSTVTNWMNEFERFAPKIPVVVYYGNKECREKLRRQLRREHTVDGMRTYPVVITSYQMPLNESYLRSISWRYLIVDEGHRLKNHKCKLVQELRRYRTVNRLLLTGTPLQNNLTELWSLLNFVLPDVIDDQYVFESWFDEEEITSEGGRKILEAERQNQVLSTLHKILKPFLLRRVKDDVELDIPPKRELIVYAPLTPVQTTLYNYVVNRAVEFMKEGTKKTYRVDQENIVEGKRRRGKSSNFGQPEDLGFFKEVDTKTASAEISKLMKHFFREEEDLVSVVKDCNLFMSLRKICQHPYLVSFPVIPGTQVMPVDERLIEHAGKLQVLDALLKRLHAGGHKVLIFSTFTQMLDILEDYLRRRSYQYCRLDGSRGLADRKENIDTFNVDTNVFAFLISTRAGGLGINLVAADTVIIFDSDWNPQVDLQAQDRCHRIGQTRPVVVYRLVVEGTIDENLIEKAECKMRLDRLVINHGKFKSLAKDEPLNPQELESLLNFTHRHKIKQRKGEVLTSAELDMLCDRKALFENNAISQDGVFKIIGEDHKKKGVRDNYSSPGND